MIVYRQGQATDEPPEADQAATAAKRGPKPKLVGGVRKQVYLDEETIAGAAELGGGELSAGLREAVKLARQASGGRTDGKK